MECSSTNLECKIFQKCNYLKWSEIAIISFIFNSRWCAQICYFLANFLGLALDFFACVSWRSFPGFPNVFAENSWLIGGWLCLPLIHLWGTVIRHISHWLLAYGICIHTSVGYSPLNHYKLLMIRIIIWYTQQYK